MELPSFLKGKKLVKVHNEDGTTKIAAMVEGSGVFICSKHQYVTDDINEWRMHEKTANHFYTRGSTMRCVICHDAHVDLTDQPVSENPVCPTCEERLVKSRERVHARLEEVKKQQKKKEGGAAA